MSNEDWRDDVCESLGSLVCAWFVIYAIIGLLKLLVLPFAIISYRSNGGDIEEFVDTWCQRIIVLAIFAVIIYSYVVYQL